MKKPLQKQQPKPKPKKQIAKPVTKTQELVNEILEQIMEGKSLRSICRSKKMPHLRTVLRWVRDDTEFYEKYIKAQEVRAELFVDEIIDLSKLAKDKNTADAIRVRIDTVKWASGKMKPKRFGDKLDITTDGEKITAIQYEIVEKSNGA